MPRGANAPGAIVGPEAGKPCRVGPQRLSSSSPPGPHEDPSPVPAGDGYGPLGGHIPRLPLPPGDLSPEGNYPVSMMSNRCMGSWRTSSLHSGNPVVDCTGSCPGGFPRAFPLPGEQGESRRGMIGILYTKHNMSSFFSTGFHGDAPWSVLLRARSGAGWPRRGWQRRQTKRCDRRSGRCDGRRRVFSRRSWLCFAEMVGRGEGMGGSGGGGIRSAAPLSPKKRGPASRKKNDSTCPVG